MGIAEYVGGGGALAIALGLALLAAPVRLVLTGLALRLLGAPKNEVADWAIKHARKPDENSLVQAREALKGTPRATPPAKPDPEDDRPAVGS